MYGEAIFSDVFWSKFTPISGPASCDNPECLLAFISPFLLFPSHERTFAISSIDLDQTNAEKMAPPFNERLDLANCSHVRLLYCFN